MSFLFFFLALFPSDPQRLGGGGTRREFKVCDIAMRSKVDRQMYANSQACAQANTTPIFAGCDGMWHRVIWCKFICDAT
jgi:hypothetical protein